MRKSFTFISKLIMFAVFSILITATSLYAQSGGFTFVPTDMHFELVDPALSTISNVGELTIFGVEYRNTTDEDGSGGPSAGDTARIDGVFAVTSFINSNGGIIFGTGVNDSWEMTGTYVNLTDIVLPVVLPGSIPYITNGGDITQNMGVVTLYVSTDLTKMASAGTGLGYDDGTMVAQFVVMSGGGVYNIVEPFDGSRDMFMNKQSTIPGLFVPDINGALFDSNLDADSNNNNIGGDDPAPTSWPYPYDGINYPWDYFTENDGSMRFGNIEPLCGDGNVDTDQGETCDPPTGYCTGATLPRTPCQSDSDCTAGETCGLPVAPADGGAADRICRDGDGSPDQCTYCGDGIEQPNSSEECDDGNDNNDDSCRNDCTEPRCGDNIVDPGEKCDPPGSVPDPNFPDNVCRNGGTDYQCTYCGDGDFQPGAGEECDFNDPDAPDNCNTDCTLEQNCSILVDKTVDCGGGPVDQQLVVADDDGINGCSANNTDVITVSYRVQNTGDVNLVNCMVTDSNPGIIPPVAITSISPGVITTFGPVNVPLVCSDELEAGEPDTLTVTCDCAEPDGPLGDRSAFDTATFECNPICGDGIVGNTPGETCDPPLDPPSPNPNDGSCREGCTFCGDGIQNNGEICDFEDPDAPANCNTSCELEPICGDGIVGNTPGETCDPPLDPPSPNPNDGSCREGCTFCGDGIQNNGEICDFEDPDAPANCNTSCELEPICGDGIVGNTPGETCDPPGSVPTTPDGNQNECRNGGSDYQCTYCGDDITQEGAGEQCDDGNSENGDGCSNNCMIPVCEIIVTKTCIVPPPPDDGGHGCTPGYWKQDQHFGSWVGYNQSDDYETVFGVGASFTTTLLGAMEQGGGGEIALGRHAVAALLNASNPDVDYFTDEAGVIALVQNAYVTGAFETVKNVLDFENNRGCELGRNTGDSEVIALVVNSDGSTTYDPAGAKECTVLAGTEVTYNYEIENTGSVNLSIIEVIDDPDPGDPFEVPGSPIQDLAPGNTETLMSQAVIDETTLNTVTVTGNPGPEQCIAMDTAKVIVRERPPITRTIGYWKTHPTVIDGSFDGPGGFPSLLPLDFCGEDIVESCDAVSFLSTGGGGINCFKRQAMGALLNCQAFGCPDEILNMIMTGSDSCGDGMTFDFDAACSVLDAYNNFGDDLDLPFQSPSALPKFCEETTQSNKSKKM